MSENEPTPWSAYTLSKFESFLDAYTAKLEQKFWCRRYHYIDAFSATNENPKADGDIRLDENDCLGSIAGYGRNQPEHLELTQHLPVTAVEIRKPFKTYILFEQSKNRDHLESLAKRHQGLKIRIVRESCSDYLQRLSLRTSWQSQRALLLLDPFLMQINWETFTLLAQTKAIEILLNFPVGAALQRKLPRDSVNMPLERRACLNRFFGSTEWFDILYGVRTANRFHRVHEEHQAVSNPTQQADAVRRTDPGKRLVSWYRSRLLTIFNSVSKPSLIRNNNEGQLYYLLFAAHKVDSVNLVQTVLDLGELEDSH